ncbi:MAG: hypothetical protein GY768_24160, partial [Planctomycetaceae bacterium]|nr:hypothetical protein [Planctomycetaceae bacterium]
MASTPAQARDEAQEAETIRHLVREQALQSGDRTSYDRLGIDGSDGYPGLDDLTFLGAVLGGSLIAQIGDVQILKGEGPLVGHLLSRVVEDGAGHSSMHWEVFQSWYVIEIVDVEDIDTKDDKQDTFPVIGFEHTSQKDLDPLLQRRLKIPGAADSLTGFEAFFAELSREMAKDQTLRPDKLREESTLVGNATLIEQFIETNHEEWPLELKHLSLIALHIYKCRLADVYMREYVMLTHVILGRGHELLRAHDRTTYIWNNPHGVWHRYEGLLPEDVYTFLKKTFLILEGLFRTFIGDVDRTDTEVLKAISESFQRHGNDWTRASVAYADAASFCMGGRREPQHRRPRSERVWRRSTPEDDDDTVGEDTREALGPSDPSEPWYIFVAKGIARITRSLERHLLGTKLLSYYAEWCSVPWPDIRGVAYLDIAFVYDDPPGEAMRRTQSDTERKNLYVGIPFRILEGASNTTGVTLSRNALTAVDSTLRAATDRVHAFYAQTFWSNQAAYKASLAALAIAKRSENVDTMFFLLGHGGRGSLAHDDSHRRHAGRIEPPLLR